MKENTCAACPAMKVASLGCRSRHAYCTAAGEMDGMIVPHKYDGENSPDNITFWRVPANCPRPDSEVEKNESRIPEKHWVEIDATASHLTLNHG